MRWATPLRRTLLRPGPFATNAVSWSAAIRAGGLVEQPYPDAHTAPIHPADIVDVAEIADIFRAWDVGSAEFTKPDGLPALTT